MLLNLFKECMWIDIKNKLLQLYPDQMKSIDAYEEFFDYISNKTDVTPRDDCQILFETGLEGKVNVRIQKDNVIYAVLNPWDDMISWSIHPQTLKRYSKQEIVTHCAWEMTFYGFDINSIPDFINSLRSSHDTFIPLS